MKTRDLNYTKCILDENQRILVKEERFERNGKVTLKNFLMKAIQKIGKSWVTQLRIETIYLFEELS